MVSENSQLYRLHDSIHQLVLSDETDKTLDQSEQIVNDCIRKITPGELVLSKQQLCSRSFGEKDDNSLAIQVWNYDVHIVYSVSYQVPVLYFNVYNQNGTLVQQQQSTMTIGRRC
ncbi:hypothetical protein GZH46_03037, partial [Fragariocoptes setiger]